MVRVMVLVKIRVRVGYCRSCGYETGALVPCTTYTVRVRFKVRVRVKV